MNLISRAEIAGISEDSRSAGYKRFSKNFVKIEHFCVGVNTKVYDVGVVKRLAGRYFICIFDKFSPLIEKKRSLNNSDRHYSESENTVAKLKKCYKSD